MKTSVWGRLGAMIAKEFIQMRRDRMTFAMMIGIPLIQLMLFGYAINNDPKDLPSAVVVHTQSEATRSILSTMSHTGYFSFLPELISQKEADTLMKDGRVQFVIQFPSDFERKLQRGERPALLVEADATDPVTTGNALAALANLPKLALKGQGFALSPDPFEVRLHRRYNPEAISQYNIVPGLMGVILTMTMVLVTAVAITRERERGTMEYLLVTPIRPLEVMVGKIVPYILLGYIQVLLILIAAAYLFHVPMRGSVSLVLLLILPFIAANLGLGITFSTMAKNQLQAMQMSFFFFLPSIMLSGFMFPFRGMPDWAQAIGEVLPLTHFLRIIRGILLKDAQMLDVLPELWPILAFLVGSLLIAAIRYKPTLE